MVINQKCWAGLLVSTALFLLVGCAEEEPYSYDYDYPPPYGYYGYYYYPDVEVYYYPHRHIYWWHEHGHWYSGRHVPPNIHLHEHVRVDLNTRQPWRQHTEVMRRYPHPSVGHLESPHGEPHEAPHMEGGGRPGGGDGGHEGDGHH